ncbi:DUF4870 domain-containing protein [Demequina sp. TTPB684]|uniref:DUF4870 domain-containing protein n=1 Tax=unclassified Demequina TaxID=2620311 RepID=UPI001CF455F8|nr:MULTISPECIES: DUF4870 domain-containing protein [unclassified Demequina]MCB2413319.1 DUF4870 domain-containing protein [Demequina sp. TTPB684]UPU88962.1 DUF4870 domain-containing protein [Demequina sp. TMPB413]
MTENTSPDPEQGAQNPAPFAPTVQPMLESEARTWAMLAHVIAAVASLVSAGTIAFVAPLVIWLVYKDRSALVAHHGKQNLNLQITALVFGAGAVVLGLLLFVVGLAVTLPLWGLYVLYAIIISFVAGVKAANGEYYRIPLAIQFIK